MSEYLVSRPDTDLCDRCIAEHTFLPFDAAADQIALLGQTPVYLRDTWKCADCGEHGMVTRALRHRA